MAYGVLVPQPWIEPAPSALKVPTTGRPGSPLSSSAYEAIRPVDQGFTLNLCWALGLQHLKLGAQLHL